MPDTITSSGVVLNLDDAEAAVLARPEVSEAVAVGIKDNFLGQALQIYVKLAEGISPSNDLRGELLDAATERLGGFRPRALRFAARIPHGADGRPARRAVAAIARGDDVDPDGLDDPSALADIAQAG